MRGRSGLALTLTNTLVNMGAVGTSSSLNVYFMRSAEAKKGIAVMDPTTGENLGTSTIAAKKAINQTIMTRWLYLLPTFCMSPLLQVLFSAAKLMPRRGRMKTAAELTFIIMGLNLAVPIGCGFFP